MSRSLLSNCLRPFFPFLLVLLFVAGCSQQVPLPPVIGDVAKTAVSTLLNALNARYLLISYPMQTLGGRRKGLGASYEQQFQVLAAERGWQQYHRFEFATELAFLVTVPA